MKGLQGKVLQFGPFRIDAGQRVVSRNGDSISLAPKEFDTLLVLVENSGDLVEKEALIAKVWPDTFVGDGSLARNISVLRKALGEDVIQTVPKLGYRLALQVTAVPANLPPVEPPIRTHPESVSAADRVAVTQNKWLFQYKRLFLATAPLATLMISLLIYERLYVSGSGAQAPIKPLRIAVLPFVNLTGNPQQEYLCDGLTEAMISEMSRLNPDKLSVIARTSAMHYKQTTETVPQIATELNVDYLLESSLRGSGDRLEITTQLVRGADASHVWSGDYERELRDSLDLQQQVAMAIADEIQLNLSPETHARLRSTHPVNPEAYRDYLFGRFLWSKRTGTDLGRALQYFNRSISRDPSFALAYSGLADTYSLLPEYASASPGEVSPLALAAAQKAVHLDNTLAEAHTSLAFLSYGDFHYAEQQFQQAITLNPNYANAHHWYATFLHTTGRTQQALSEIQRAQELDPFSIGILADKGWLLVMAGQKKQGIETLVRLAESEPSSVNAHRYLSRAYFLNGEYERYMKEAEKTAILAGDKDDLHIIKAAEAAYARGGYHAMLEARLRVQEQLLRRGGYSPFPLAETSALLGKNDDAFRYLDQALKEKTDGNVFGIKINPFLKNIHSDPRYPEVIRLIGLSVP